MNKIFFLLLTLASAMGAAEVVVNYDQLLKLKAPPQLHAELKPNQLKKLSPLSRLKLSEIKKQWNECSLLGISLFAGEKKVQAWVLNSGLNCALRIEKEKAKISLLKNYLQILAQNISYLDRGPWKSSLQSNWNSALSFVWSKEQSSSHKNKIQTWALIRPELLSPENKKVFESPRFNESPPGSAADSRTVRTITVDELAEALADQKLVKLVVEKKELELLSQIVQFLKEFPLALNAKKWKEKSQEIWTRSQDLNSLNSKEVLQILLDSDPERLLEWAQWTYRKSYYQDAALFAEKFIKESKDVISKVSAYSLLAKSQLFLGRYEEAKKSFIILVNQYSNSEEGLEAQFRLGLLNFRLGDFSAAQKNFERAILSAKDRNDLQSRYWWIRCLELQNDVRVNEEKIKIVQDFPFSYYGLKLNAELNKDRLLFEKAPAEKVSVVKSRWISDSADVWIRFETLSKAGWLVEASSELSGLRSPSDPEEAMSLSLLQAHWGQYSSSIRLANQVYEQSPKFKNLIYSQHTFPLAFEAMIASESAKYKLNAVVIQSLIRQESAYSLKAISTSNALGLMQMIPPTAVEVAQKLKLKINIPEDLFRPEVNIRMGTFYFAELMNSFQGHIPLSLASYNAGPTRIRLWLNSRPETKDLAKSRSTQFRDEIWIDELPWSETSFYVKAILRNMILYSYFESKNDLLKSSFWSDFSSQSVNSL
jgi:soluble lytic murein transglycosylase